MEKEKKYRLGIYIRNSAAGVGTLTFYEPNTGAYGALGHVISDVDTQRPIMVGDGGSLIPVFVQLEKGEQGIPGKSLPIFRTIKR